MVSIRFAIIIFKLLCIATAGFMVGFWVYKFQKNEDISVIEYKAFKDSKEIFYPELTLCFAKPIEDEKWNNISRGLNKMVYLERYLGGRMPANETYYKIPYGDASINFFEYIDNIRFAWNDKSIPRLSCSNKQKCPFLISFNSFNGFLDPANGKTFSKCFGLAINSTYAHNISSMEIDLNDSEFEKILEQQIIPAMFINYPNQKFRNAVFFELIWHDKNERNANYVIYMNSIEVLRRRNKSGKQCIPNYDYDGVIIAEEIKKVGCRPPYYQFHPDLPTCTKPEDLNRLAKMKNELSENKIPPCHEMSHASYKFYKEFKSSPMFTLEIEYPKHVKDISQEQKIDHHALIGNIGGYIGLFLGILVYHFIMVKIFGKFS